MATKLLLIQDVDKIGRSGEIVNVKPGFARNFLLPRGFGVVANKNALRMQEKLQEERRLKAEEDKKEAEKIAKRLDGITLNAIVKVDQSGHMYGSVSVLDILGLFETQHQVVLEKKVVDLKHPVKKLGEHTIALNFGEGVLASFTLQVVTENADLVEPIKE